MPNLIEFKVTKTLFSDVLNDDEFRCGFETEMHVRNASDLLRDEHGNLPDDFESFNDNELYKGDQFHEETALFRLATLFEKYLGLPPKSLVAHDSTFKDTSDFTTWKLTSDLSLYRVPKMLVNPDDDFGVELISPVMHLKEGLAWMAKVFEMIAQFRHEDISLYTTEMCGFHINLSHIRMGRDFDFAKLAIMSGDEHYLRDFKRVGNTYTAPLLRAVYDQLVSVKQTPEPSVKQTPALNLLKLRGWNARRVMSDLASLIPMDHHMSIDFSRIDSYNPYIEIRIAGNKGYEQRYAEIAQLTVRFGALIKIACDPYAYREEYLKKIYQLVAGVVAAEPAAQPQPDNPMPRIRVYLSPVMSTATRSALDQIETYWRRQTLTIPNGAYLFLAIVRSTFDMRQNQNQRIRQGLVSLMQNVLRITPLDLLKALKNNALLLRYGVMRPADKSLPLVTMLTNYIKGLNQPVASLAR